MDAVNKASVVDGNISSKVNKHFAALAMPRIMKVFTGLTVVIPKGLINNLLDLSPSRRLVERIVRRAAIDNGLRGNGKVRVKLFDAKELCSVAKTIEPLESRVWIG